MKMRALQIAQIWWLAPFLVAGAAEPAPAPLAAEVREHLGRPTLFVNDEPMPIVAYSPAGFWNRDLFERQMGHFLPGPIDTFFVSIGVARTPEGKPEDFWATPLWLGDEISATPLAEFKLSPDEQAATILAGKRDPLFIVRFGLHEPDSWRQLHPDDLVVTEDGKRLPVPSLASEAYWDSAARYAAAAIEFSEGRPWANRIVGYANFLRMEGTHEPMLNYAMFDHSAAMTSRWRRYLRDTYGTVEKLRAAHGDADLTFDTARVPTDRLRGAVADVARINTWQAAADNRPLRDYLLLQRDLYHAGFRRVAAASQAALEKLGRRRFLIYDSHKSVMLGWDNTGFFNRDAPWPHAYPELMAGSGNMGIASLFAGPGIGGLITPHDYQARGAGGVFEPEGVADSAVLRGKLMLCEMDTRTWAGTDPIAPARDSQEFAAVTWRNIATALTRGFTPYWMDVYQDWFAPESLQPIIARQAGVLREAAAWPHETVPGIAMILDDEAVLETNGDGRFMNEAVMWEWKTGLARSGVPLRIHLLEDLTLPNFPPHRVFYFPNLFRIDAARRKILEEKVLRNGNVVVWGPGTGISDGATISAAQATAVTGFEFDLLPVNDHRRTLLADVSHPLTKGLSPATVLGGPLAYGPVLLPRDGHMLGRAWTKLGRDLAGLAVKEQQGADGSKWTSVFTSTPGLPAGFWRNAARLAGAHVWCETDDIVLADSSLVAIHSAAGGPRKLLLPRACDVEDVVTGQPFARQVREINVELKSPETRVFRMLPPAAPEPFRAAADAWPPEKARAWQEKKGWLVGCNYTPATAVNQLEMWQPETFDPERIDLELSWAKSLGFNSIRVFLHDLPYAADPRGFLDRIDRFLAIADRHGIGVMLVFFDSCWDPQPQLGPQRPPRPHVHNSGWVQSPGREILGDESRHAELEAYVKAVIGRFKDDPRVHAWDLYNEPDASNRETYGDTELSDKATPALALARKAIAWARAVEPSQPLTICVWQGDWSDPQRLPPLARFSLANSDVVSFHNYGNQGSLQATIRHLRQYGRPLLCTEYVARPFGSTFDPLLANLKEEGVGAYNWGFVAGKTQTNYPWDSWQKKYGGEPPLWFHDIFRTDGTPYRLSEVLYIRHVTGAKAPQPASSGGRDDGLSPPQR